MINDLSTCETLRRIKAEIRRQAQSGYESMDTNVVMALSSWGRRQTERLFRDHYLTSPARYFRDCQAEHACKLLCAGVDVLSAAVQAGFASPGRLHDTMVSRYGLTPGEIRRGASGVTIFYGTFETQMGVVVLGATARGLCSLSLCGLEKSAERVNDALEELERSYPYAEFVESLETVQPYADQLVAFLDKRAPTFNPPLDILRGTTFQREVWAELRKLKPGETVSYSELAARIGRPDAVRACASACAQNHLAIAIPCHRAVRKDGSLSGFRWGVEWKKRLLTLEYHIAHSDSASA